MTNVDFIARLEAAESRNAELADVLQSLVDLQNGCPLPKYEADWNRTMERAKVLLAAKEPSI